MIIIEEYEECDRNDIVLIKSQTYYKLEFLTNCDALKPGCPLTTRQPAEYSWMLGNPTPLMKIG